MVRNMRRELRKGRWRTVAVQLAGAAKSDKWQAGRLVIWAVLP